MTVATIAKTGGKKTDRVLPVLEGTALAAARKIEAAKTVDSELSWLSQRIERGRKEEFAEIADVTPVIARHLLDTNPNNRAVSQRKIDTFAADIRASRWDMNGEGIIVARTGELNDGQHRLQALVDAGVPVRMLLVFGVERDSRLTVDTGTARTTGDFLAMEGAKNGHLAASIASLHLLWRNGVYGKHGYKRGSAIYTKKQIQDEFWRYEKPIAIAAAMAASDAFARTVKAGTPVGTAHVILTAVNAEAAERFFHGLLTGESLRAGSPVLRLRSHLMAVRDQRLQRQEKLELILRYWNAFRNSREDLGKRLPLMRAYPKVEN